MGQDSHCLARACAVRLHAWAARQAGQFLVIRTCQPIGDRPELLPGTCVNSVLGRGHSVIIKQEPGKEYTEYTSFILKIMSI